MIKRNSAIGSLILCLLTVSGFAIASEMQSKSKPKVIIATAPEVIIGKLKTSAGRELEVKGEAVYTITSANSDDTFYGKLTVRLTEPFRQKFAQLSQKSVHEIPEVLVKNNIKAFFEPGTSCPRVRLSYSFIEVEIAGGKARLERFKLRLIENQSEEMKVICNWLVCINRGMSQCDGKARQLNLLLKGEEEQ